MAPDAVDGGSRDRRAHPPLLLRPEDAASRLSISRSRVYELMAEGRLPSVTIGRSRRVRSEDLARFVAELPGSGSQSVDT